MTATSDELPLAGRHPSVREIGRWFTYRHLPAHLQPVSIACVRLAAEMIAGYPDSPELTAGLRKLLEAKDCFVRAAIAAQEDQP
jgi:hypothetical protein